MAINLHSLHRVAATLPPLIMFYGVAGMGKTSIALDCPNSVYIQIAPESPPRGVEAMGFGELTSYAQVIEAISSLYTGEHAFSHVVIDSIDALEPLVWRETCLRNQWQDIETPGFGKGYLAADHVWRELLDGLNALRRDRNIAVTMLALADAQNHEEPGKQPYKRYDLRVHKRADSLLTQAVDAVLFLNTKVEVKETDAGFGKKVAHASSGGGSRFLFTDARPAFVAKNRFRMPEQILLPATKPWAAIEPFLRLDQPAETAAAQTAA